MTPDIDITSGFDNNFLPISFYPFPPFYLFIHFFFLMSKNPLKEYFYNFFTLLWDKYKVNDYSHWNQCSRRKITFSIQQLQHPKVSMNPSSVSLCLLLFTSQTKKGRKLCPEKDRCACVTRLSHPYVFLARFPPSINTMAFWTGWLF